jgi:hypothetical protein
MFFRHHSDKLMYPLLVLALLAIVSYRAKYRLKAEMPAGFFSTSDAPQKHSLDKKIAWAYWESAEMNIQWKYPYGHHLPNDPPPEFSIDAHGLGPSASDPATRLLYWKRLQQVWYLPETWEKDYGWDWSWIGDPLTSASEWMRDRWNSWFAIHGPK